MDFSTLQQLKTDNLTLKKVSEGDRQFINDMFDDPQVRKYYIVPKEAQQDFRRLIAYWTNDMQQGAGYAWIIYVKSTGPFSSDKPAGFIAFEFRGSLQTARISYALQPDFRKKGIATSAITHLIDTLESMGVTTIEADIDKDNIASEKIIDKLGFQTNKRQALVDPEMMRDGEIRFRYLWKKDLSLQDLEPSQNTASLLGVDASQDELIAAINNVKEQIEAKGQHPKLIAKYLYLLGRIKFNENNYDEAKEAFGQCNMTTMNSGLPDNHETFYWFARIHEIKGEQENADMYYGFALEKYSDNPELITKEKIIEAKNNLNK